MVEYLDTAPCLYFSSTDESVIVAVNTALCQQLGYEKSELIGQKLDVVFTVATSIFQQTHFFPLLKMQGHAEEIFITLKTKNGDQLPVLVNAERKDDNGKPINIYAGIIVHNRKKFEDELIEARKAAEAALRENTVLQQVQQQLQHHAEQLDKQMNTVHQQSEELMQFNKVVTHDLQEPMRKLFIFINMLLEGGDTKSDPKNLFRIRSVAEQMRSILSGLQQYVWLRDTKQVTSKVDLSKLLLLVKDELCRQFPDVVINLQTSVLPVVEGNWEQIRFLLHEVLSNAVRFRSKPAEVSLSINGNSLKHNQFKTVPGKYKYTDYLKLEIADDGLGFDAIYKEQVFDLFRKLHSESGQGVGLALCKKIVENHNGHIAIDSTKAKGTTISIWLPLNEQLIQSENTVEMNYKQ